MYLFKCSWNKLFDIYLYFFLYAYDYLMIERDSEFTNFDKRRLILFRLGASVQKRVASFPPSWLEKRLTEEDRPVDVSQRDCLLIK